MNQTIKKILKTISGTGNNLTGAYNIRVNGQSISRSDSDKVRIESRENGDGINIYVEPGTCGEKIHIPVIIAQSGINDLVYNDFYIGKDCDIEIIAGCGIHNDGTHLTQHDGIHTFHLEENAKVTYTEKHYGEGSGTGKKVLNPVTILNLKPGSCLKMETVQIEGVNSTIRKTEGYIADDAILEVKEVLMTSDKQTARTEFLVDLNGENSKVNISSRSVAKGESFQTFYSVINGNNKCAGHSECDAIIMDRACVKAIPDVTANHVDAELIHEAAIGKIAGDQIIKLMTLGLTSEEAEKEIIQGFLK